MNIKTRILLSVIVLQIIGFSALLLNHNKRASASVLNFNRTQVSATLTATVHQLDAIAAQMERTAAGLARGGEHFQEVHHRRDTGRLRSELKRLLLRTFSSFPAAEGGGIWYEPATLDHQEDRIAPFVYRDQGQLTFTWERESGHYDYHNQPWYRLAIPADWPRNEHRPQTFYWSRPYTDSHNQQTVMTVAVPMYDEKQKLLGVATVNWNAGKMLQPLEGLQISPGTRVALYDPLSARFLTAETISPLSLLNNPGQSFSREHQTASGDYLFAARTQTGLIIAALVPRQELATLVSGFLAGNMGVNIAIAVVFIAVMALVLTILFRPFEQILQRLRDAVLLNSQSDRLTFNPIRYDDSNEFSPIVDTFNTLVDQIARYTDRLSRTNTLLYAEQRRAEELNSTLEQKVSERTRELAEKNQELNESLRMLKLTQQQLVNLEKHAALGDIVAGLAHEINTPLGISVTAVSALEEQLRDLEEQFRSHKLTRQSFDEYTELTREGVSIAADNLRRAADLIARFKQVAVDQASEQKRDFELCDYLNSILTSLRPGYKYRPVKVELNCAQRVIISSYPGALAQIITNLITNSLTHGFPPDRDDRDHPGNITLTVTEEGQNVCIIYRDDGAGMSEDTRNHLFDPFFTTRAQHGGSGLGTYIIQDLVCHQLQGTLEVSSSPGAGCEFIIRLPRRLRPADNN